MFDWFVSVISSAGVGKETAEGQLYLLVCRKKD